MKASVEELELSMDGELSDEQAEKLRVIKAHYDAITLCKNDLEVMITELGKEYAHQQELIQTVPGLKNPLTALRVISEIGINMNQFPTASHLCSWAGVVPANNEIAGKKHSARISKGGRYLKPLLIEVANAVVRSENNPEHRNKYLQLKKRRGHKKAIITITHRLLVTFTIFSKKMSHTIQRSTIIRNMSLQINSCQFRKLFNLQKVTGFKLFNLV